MALVGKVINEKGQPNGPSFNKLTAEDGFTTVIKTQ